MIKSLSYFKILPLTLLVVLGILFFSTHTAHAATFDPTRIIDDGVFYNSSSMTADQIQAFLNSKVPTCDSNGTQAQGGTTRASYTRAHGYGLPLVCLKNYYENPATHENNLTKTDGQAAPIPAGAQSAAQIILTAAQYYGINPQVLIVLLQKEQGLVTDDWPWPSQYQTATGYGCPDTAPCDSQYYGFYNQVNWAARQFRYYASNPNAFNYVPGPGNFVRYNPNASCGGTTLNIQNQATASLYDYTPYQPNAEALAAGYGTGNACSAYGNRNFWLYFNDWFGSTQFAQPAGGALLQQVSTGKVFLVSGTTRFYVPSWAMMTNYGLDAYPFQSVSDATIQQYTDGGSLTNLIYDSNGVFVVNNRYRHHVSSDMCTAWGFSCADNTAVKSLGSFQDQYLFTGGNLTQLSNINGVIYKMSGGQKQPISNEKTLADLGLTGIPSLLASAVNSTQPLGPLLITTPGIIKFSPNATIYYYDGASFYLATTATSFSDWSLGAQPAINAPTSSYNTTPPTAQSLTPWYIDSGSNKYIIDQGRRIQITPGLASLWASATFAAQPSGLANSLPKTTLQQFVWGIYMLGNGAKHYVPTWNSYLGLGITESTTTPLLADKLSIVPTGADALGDGTILTLAGNSVDMYVINNGKTTPIPTENIFIAFDYSFQNVPSYPSSILSTYPMASSPLSIASINGSGTHYIISGGTMFALSAQQAVDFGTQDSSFNSISSQTVSHAKTVSMSRFLYDSGTGKIYYASGGAIHYVASYNAFVAYGGLRSATSVLTHADINLFLEAQPIN